MDAKTALDHGPDFVEAMLPTSSLDLTSYSGDELDRFANAYLTAYQTVIREQDRRFLTRVREQWTKISFGGPAGNDRFA